MTPLVVSVNGGGSRVGESDSDDDDNDGDDKDDDDDNGSDGGGKCDGGDVNSDADNYEQDNKDTNDSGGAKATTSARAVTVAVAIRWKRPWQRRRQLSQAPVNKGLTIQAQKC